MIYETCNLTFENFWGEELKTIFIYHSDARSMFDAQENNLRFIGTFSHVKDKEILTDTLSFSYILGKKNYWRIYFTTLYGQAWETGYSFSCAIKPEDNHHVTLGVNNESKRMYVAFPSSSPCSTPIFRA